MGKLAAGRPDEAIIDKARWALKERNLVFVGLMGAGKSAIGRLVAQWLDLPFVDSDHEIERVSRMTITDLFASYGEEEFRSLEARVIERLLKTGPRVVSTGGGAFMNDTTRSIIGQNAVSVWLKADLEVLWERVSRRDNRPLLKTEDPKGTLRALMEKRYPVYAEAVLTAVSRDAPKEVVAAEVVTLLTGLGVEMEEGTAHE